MSEKEKRNYQILNTIATGGTAVLYKAIQTSLDRQVVVKRLHSHLTNDINFTRRFEIEAKAAASLDHENIVRIIDFGSSNNNYFIVMEYIDGMSLKEFIQERKQISEELTLFIAHEICMGLDHAHQRGIIHRDIKPANIMLTKEGHVKITDFGLAKLHENQTQQTVANTLLGTPLYMSPEQAIGERIDNRSDIFSLGTICYEMVTGTQPFKGDNYASVIQSIINGHVPSPGKIKKDLSPRTELIIMKALSKEPSKRYRTALDMAREIESFLGQEKLLRLKETLRRMMNGEYVEEKMERSSGGDSGRSPGRSIFSFLSIALAAAIVMSLIFFPARVEHLKSRLRAVFEPNPAPAGQTVASNENGGSYLSDILDATRAVADSSGVSGQAMIIPTPADTSRSDSASSDFKESETKGAVDVPAKTTSPAGIDTPAERQTAPNAAATQESTSGGSVKEQPEHARVTGFLEISIDPSAEIIIDGREKAFSSSLGPIELTSGRHELVCKREGYKDYREGIKIHTGELSKRNIILQKITGRIMFNTAAGARVFIDGAYKGVTPLQSPITLPAGAHSVELRKVGYKSWSNTVFVPENEDLTLTIHLVPM